MRTKRTQDENVTLEEHINAELVMSPIDQEASVRARDVRSDETELLNKNVISSGANRGDTKNYDLTRLLKKIYAHMEQLKYTFQRDTYELCKNDEWLFIALLIDKILFFFYCAIVVFATLSIFKYN
jgi:hypothetical protein